jgi:carbon storage regulator CsrA
MLILSRKKGERIRVRIPGGFQSDFGTDCWMTVVSIDEDRVRLGLEGPQEIRFDREEVAKQRAKEGKDRD